MARTETTTMFNTDAFRDRDAYLRAEEEKEAKRKKKNDSVRELSNMVEANNGTNPADDYFKTELLRYSKFDEKIAWYISEIEKKYGETPEGKVRLEEINQKNPKEAVLRAKLVKSTREKHSALKQVSADLEEKKYDKALDYVSKREKDLGGVMDYFNGQAEKLIKKYNLPPENKPEALKKIREKLNRRKALDKINSILAISNKKASPEEKAAEIKALVSNDETLEYVVEYLKHDKPAVVRNELEKEIESYPETSEAGNKKDAQTAERLELAFAEWAKLPSVKRALELQNTIQGA